MVMVFAMVLFGAFILFGSLGMGFVYLGAVFSAFKNRMRYGKPPKVKPYIPPVNYPPIKQVKQKEVKPKEVEHKYFVVTEKDKQEVSAKEAKELKAFGIKIEEVQI